MKVSLVNSKELNWNLERSIHIEIAGSFRGYPVATGYIRTSFRGPISVSPLIGLH